MATRINTCPTCGSQTTITMCDNCGNDIPTNTDPDVSGRVWDPNSQNYLPIVLCNACADLSLDIRAVATGSTTK